jgi:hypothetical protein
LILEIYSLVIFVSAIFPTHNLEILNYFQFVTQIPSSFSILRVFPHASICWWVMSICPEISSYFMFLGRKVAPLQEWGHPACVGSVLAVWCSKWFFLVVKEDHEVKPCRIGESVYFCVYIISIFIQLPTSHLSSLP